MSLFWLIANKTVINQCIPDYILEVTIRNKLLLLPKFRVKSEPCPEYILAISRGNSNKK